MSNMNFTFIIPTKNEIGDICDCIDAIFATIENGDEIIVVDDSDDGTADYVNDRYGSSVLLYRGLGKGLNAAYNMGIGIAKNAILVLTTADNLVQTDFRNKLLDYYQDDYGAVVCRSQAINIEDLTGKYFRYIEDYKYDRLENYMPLWSEGFSCLKTAALNAGMLRENKYVVGGTDNLFAMNVANVTKTKYDKSILVKHVVPKDVITFSKQMFNRGLASVHLMQLTTDKGYVSVWLLRSLKATVYLCTGLLIFPSAIQIMKMRDSEGALTLVKLILLHVYSNILIAFGMYSGLMTHIKR